MTDYAYRGRLQGLTAWCNVAAFTMGRKGGKEELYWQKRKRKRRTKGRRRERILATGICVEASGQPPQSYMMRPSPPRPLKATPNSRSPESTLVRKLHQLPLALLTNPEIQQHCGFLLWLPNGGQGRHRVTEETHGRAAAKHNLPY